MPTIDCHPLPVFADTDLAAVRAAFEDAAPIPLGQPWLGAEEAGFSPGTVRTGWRDDVLLVLAELTDADIFTRARRHNDRLWELGDSFEIFLRSSAGAAYMEFQVAPNNLRLQLRFRAAPEPPAPPIREPFEASLIQGGVFQSRTWVNADAREWCVLAEIPAASVGDGAAPLAGSTWRCSFGRYDYTRDRDRPVISSSSAHSELQFHRPHEWGVLRFRA
jgi:hypothetical protein